MCKQTVELGFLLGRFLKGGRINFTLTPIIINHKRLKSHLRLIWRDGIYAAAPNY